MTYDFELTATVPASPLAVYDAWMSSTGHAAMTGGAAEIDPTVGGLYEEWDGYITGTTLALEPGRRIVQSWRTSEFAEGDEDSQIEVLLVLAEGGTLLTLRHTDIPDGQSGYEDGWEENYFEPMREYFGT